MDIYAKNSQHDNKKSKFINQALFHALTFKLPEIKAWHMDDSSSLKLLTFAISISL